MLEKGRLNQIMDSLRQHHNLTVTEISKQLYVSEATVRRDLTRLEQMGFIKRVHGGAVLLGNAQSEPPLVLRARQNAQPKIQIAAEAARYLRNGQTIFLDASSTVMHLVKHLEELQSITIVTNGLKTAIELQPLYQHTVYCTGGCLLHNSSAYAGGYAEDFIRRFNAAVFFFSSRGVSDMTRDGRITDSSDEETHLRRVMLAHSAKHIFLCDSSKVGKVYSHNLCTVGDVDRFITNTPET